MLPQLPPRLLVVALVATLAACGTRFPARSADPRVGRLEPVEGPAAGGTTLVIEGLAFQAGARVYFGEAEATATFVSSVLMTATAPAQAAGRRDVTVINPDGLRSVAKLAFEYVQTPKDPAPTLTEVSPGSGPAAGRTFAELRGTGLAPGALVFVGGIPAGEVLTVAPEVVTALLPSGEVGPADVSVTNPDGQTVTLSKGYTRAATMEKPPPLVTGVLPTSGPTSGGVKGTLTGANFWRGSRVYIGGRLATSVFQTETLLDVAVPEGKPGLTSVAVTNPDGQSDFRPNLFGYYQPGPSLFLVAPDNAHKRGGDEIVIAGSNFTHDTVVTFAEQPAAKVTFENDRLLTVVTPPRDQWGIVDVVVKNRDGQQDVMPGGFFFFDQDHPVVRQTEVVAPALTRVMPSTGSGAGGTLLLVSGAGFAEGMKAKFGEVEASGVKVLSSSALSLRTPAASTGPVDVTVLRPDGKSATLKLGFTFYDAGSTAAAPAISLVAPSTGPAAGGTRGTLFGRNFVTGTMVYFGGVAATRTTVIDPTTLTFVAPPGMPGLVDVVALNPDGRSARLALGFAFYVPDGAGPQLTGVEPPAAVAGHETRVSLAGTEFTPGAQVYLGDHPGADVAVADATRLDVTLPPLGPGAYDVSLTNPDGRTTTLTAGFRYTTPVPQVRRVSPAVGPVEGGLRVVVQGVSFLPGATVLIGTAPATDVVVLGDSALVATAPAGIAGLADVVVANPGGTEGKLSNAFEYREGYAAPPPPALGSVLPPSGPATGGTVMLLTGTNLQPGLTVYFRDVPSRAQVGHAGEAVVMAPAGAVGPADLTLLNPDGQVGYARAAFRYVDPTTLGPAPLLTGVVPSTGPQTGATDIGLSGRRFGQGALVFVGAYYAPFARRESDTLISSRADEGQSGPVDVAVTNADGQSSVLAPGFTYRPAPRIESISPPEAAETGGDHAKIAGLAFELDTRIYFGDVEAHPVTFQGSTQLDVAVPAHAAGVVDVKAVNPDGQQFVARGAFTYKAPALRVDSVLPWAGPLAGGTPVTLVGSGFATGTTVRFGSTSAVELQVRSPTSMTMRTPAVDASGPVDVTVHRLDGATAVVSVGFVFYDGASNLAPPLLAGVTPTTGPVAGGTRGILSGRDLAPGADVYFGGVKASRAVRIDASRLTFVAPAHDVGLVDVTLVNPDGHAARLSQAFAYASGDGPFPQVNGITPPSASAGATAKVSVTGADFAAGALVFLGDLPATDVSVTNAGQLSATLPSLSPDAYDLWVTNLDGRTGSSTGGFRYTVPVPQVTRVIPTVGPTTGGLKVLVQGKAFLSGASVLFGSNAATDVLYIDDGALLVTAPAGTNGKVTVTVVNGSGTEASLTDAFEYREGYVPQPPPRLDAVLPPSGPSSGGTVMLLKGAGFQEGMLVLFGRNAARKVLVGKAQEAVVVAPAGSIGAVDLTVINPDGQVAGMNAGFRYVDPSSLGPSPVLTGVIPNTGPQSAPTDILLTGRAFTQGALVFVGVFAAPYARRDSPTLVASRAPAGQAGPVDVSITNPDGQSSTVEGGFNYRPSPLVQSVNPTEAPTDGGKQVQVFGQAFERTSKVYFGSTPADSVTFVGTTLLIAQSPRHAAGVVEVVVANSDGQEGVLANAFTFRAPPTLSAVLPGGGPVTGGTIAAITGLAFRPGAKVLFDGTEVPTGYGDDQTLTVVVPKGAFAGQKVPVTVVNPDGQANQQAVTFGYTDPALLTTPDPKLTSVTPNSGPDKGGSYVAITGTNLVAGAIAFVDNRLMSSVKVGFGTSLTGVVPSGNIGAVRVAVTNPDGRSTELAPGFTYVDGKTLGAPPTLVSISPQAGITRGGEVVAIGGTALSMTPPPLVILAGFVSGQVSALSSGSLSVRTGQGLVTTGDVVVTNPDGQSAVLPASWTYTPASPSFAATNAVTPPSGPTKGGTVATINGLDFEPGAEVRFGTSQGTNVLVKNPTQLTVRVPPGPIGKVDITIVNPGGKNGTLTNGFEYIPPPLVLTVTPPSGTQAGGNAIVINGRYFLDVPSSLQVKVGQNLATAVKVESTTVISAVAPAGTGTAAVTVINGDGQSMDLPSGYVYLPNISPPTITSLSPDNGESAGNTYLTIVGSGFTAGAKVFFGSAEAADVQVMSAGALTCRTPAGVENTSVDVTVTNPPFPGGLSVTKTGAFLYRPGRSLGALAVTFVSPQQGPCAGGTELLIGGEGIKTGAKVYLNGIEQNNIVVMGPTAMRATTKAFGDPLNCPKTTMTLRVQNPTLEFKELTGAASFSYVGGNRRFVYANNDRLPPESWGTKSYKYGAMPVISRLSGATGGGKNLSEIVFGRRAGGSFLYDTPTFTAATGIIWNDGQPSVKKYDPSCATSATTKVRPINKNCPQTADEWSNDGMYMPVVADFDLNGWNDILYYEIDTGGLVILYNDAGVLTRYLVGMMPASCSWYWQVGYGPQYCTTFCATGSACAPSSNLPTGTIVGFAVANVDLDSAGKPDIVVATTGIDFVLRNGTTPTEAGRANWTTMTPSGASSLMRYQGNANPTGDDSRGVAAADIDGDGDVDVIIGGNNIPVKIYLSDLNNIPGDLATRQAAFGLRDSAGAPFGTSTAWSGVMHTVQLQDFDKDGDPDLLITHVQAQDEYWTNDGLGHFTSETIASTKCGSGRRMPVQLAQDVYYNVALDLDADGDLDLVQWMNPDVARTRPLRIYRNDPQSDNPARSGCFVEATNDFFPSTGADAPWIHENMGFGDIDGDGYPDAVSQSDGRQNRVYFNVLENGKRVFRDKTRVRFPMRWDTYTSTAALVDVDGDNDLDMLLTTSETYLSGGAAYYGTAYAHPQAESRLRLYLNDGAGYFSDATGHLPNTTMFASVIVPGDVDGDGDQDLLLPNFAGGGEYRLYINNGVNTGVFSDQSYPRLPTGEPSNGLYGRTASLVDLDGDGDLDILAGASGNEARIWLNDGKGFFTDITPSAAPWMGTVASAQGGSYTPSYWGAFPGRQPFVRDIIVSDFDFNGTLDLFFAREAGGNFLALNCPDPSGRPVYYYATGSAPCAPVNAPITPSGSAVVAGAVKRDDGGTMVTDIILYQDSTSLIRAWRGSKVTPGRLADETPAYIPTGLPATGDEYLSRILAPLDYDKDGDTDFLLIGAVGQTHRILRNSGIFTDVLREPTPFNPMPPYNADDTRGAIAGDIDGDGFTDLLMLNVGAPRILLNVP